MLLTAAELLAGAALHAGAALLAGPPPSRDEIRRHMSGNYCRCTGYHAIVDAIESVARQRAEEAR